MGGRTKGPKVFLKRSTSYFFFEIVSSIFLKSHEWLMISSLKFRGLKIRIRLRKSYQPIVLYLGIELPLWIFYIKTCLALCRQTWPEFLVLAMEKATRYKNNLLRNHKWSYSILHLMLQRTFGMHFFIPLTLFRVTFQPFDY